MKVYARIPLNISEISIPTGQVYLIPDRCKGCEVCVHFCPREVLTISDQRNVKGYRIPMVINGQANECINCEFCMLVCPEFAIFTLPVEANQNG